MAGMVLGSIGGYFFGPIGQILGSALGNYLSTKKTHTEGPKLTDLRVMSAAAGETLPKVYGTSRLAPKVIWAPPKKEISNTTRQGKGGSKQTTTTYTYTASLALLLSEGEIEAVTQIRANGKLIYNTSDGANIQTLIASSGIAKSITLYTGTDTQLPDPLMVSIEGADKVSAYRGSAYLVIEDLDLSPYGQQMPNLEVTLIGSGASSTTVEQVLATFPSFVSGFYNPFPDYYSSVITNVNNPQQLKTFVSGYSTAFDYTNGVNGFIQVFDLLPTGEAVPTGVNMGIPASTVSLKDMSLSSHFKSDNNSCLNVIRETGTFYQHYYLCFADGDMLNIDAYGPGGNNSFNYGLTQPVGVFKNGRMFLSSDGTFLGANQALSVVNFDGRYPTGGSTISISSYIRDIDSTLNHCYTVDDTGGEVRKYDNNLTDLGLVFSVTPSPSNNIIKVCSVNDNKIFILGEIGGVNGIFEVSTGTAILVKNVSGTVLNSFGGLFSYNNDFYCVKVVSSTTTNVYFFSTTYANSMVPVAGIIEDLLLKSKKITLDKMDLTAITESVHGYTVTRTMSIRNAVEPLLDYCFYDLIESGGKLKAVKRGGAPVDYITELELGVKPDGSQPPDSVKISRTQDVELPEQINITFIDKMGGYLPNSTFARRQFTESVNKINIDISISDDVDNMTRFANAKLDESWNERTSVEFSLGPKYMYLEPSDVVNLTKDNLSFNVKIKSKDESPNGVIKFVGVTTDSTVYEQKAVGSQMIAQPEQVVLLGPTQLKLLDIPLLRDQDDKVGFYAAMTGFLDGWAGAQAFKSLDDGASFTTVGPADFNSSTIGYTKSVLGSFTTDNVFDKINSVTVVVNDELSSCTMTQLLANVGQSAVNCAMIGSELVQFMTATLVDTDTYVLTDFLRGRKGTEWAIGTHAINETFVLLDTTLTLLPSGNADYDIQRKYKAVTIGDYLLNADEITFTNTGVAQECYAPVALGGGRNAALDILMDWKRRTRLSGEWINYVDVPLGEDSEKYDVEILNGGGAVVRTFSNLTSPAATYTVAHQITDFGSAQASITFKVYQLSALRGRGYPAQKTL